MLEITVTTSHWLAHNHGNINYSDYIKTLPTSCERLWNMPFLEKQDENLDNSLPLNDETNFFLIHCDWHMNKTVHSFSSTVDTSHLNDMLWQLYAEHLLFFAQNFTLISWRFSFVRSAKYHSTIFNGIKIDWKTFKVSKSNSIRCFECMEYDGNNNKKNMNKTHGIWKKNISN